MFIFVSCNSHALSSFHCCLVVSCWKRADYTTWLLLVMFIVFLLLYHVVSWVRCGALLYRFLIFAVFLTLIIRVVLSVLSGGPKKSARTFI